MKEIETDLTEFEEIDIKTEEDKIEVESPVEKDKHKTIDPKPLLSERKSVIIAMDSRLFNWGVDKWDLITEIYFHVYCIATFEVIFFFHYIVTIEKDQMKMLINSFARNINKIIKHNDIDLSNDYNAESAGEVCEKIDNRFTITENYELEVYAHNAISCFTGLLGIILLIHLYLYKNMQKLRYIFYKTVVLLGIIGAFEYVFFTNIILDYKIIDRELAFCVFVSKINQN